MALAPASVVKDLGSDQPIIDDPATVKELYGDIGIQEPEPKEPEPQPWEQAITSLAEGQKALQDRIAEISETLASGFSRQPAPVQERIIERSPAPPPEAPRWAKSLKEEQAELLREAVQDVAGGLIREYQEQQLSPALQYVLKNQERLLEANLYSQYPDEDFGFAALRDDAALYRQALARQGYNTDIETAYKHVAFEKTNAALAGARRELLADKQKAKEEAAVSDDGSPARADAADAEMGHDEMRAARSFFGGADPRTGKMRTDTDVRSLWMAHQKGAERDKNPYLDVDLEPEFKRGRS